jgi:hypothetical protein
MLPCIRNDPSFRLVAEEGDIGERESLELITERMDSASSTSELLLAVLALKLRSERSMALTFEYDGGL